MTTLSQFKLSPTQISALVVLMAEARAVSNPEMKELAGFDLTGGNRTRLVDLNLIRSEKRGGPFVHELTDHGWRRVRELLLIDAIGGKGPARGALRVLMKAFDLGLRRHQKSAGDFFYNGQAPAVESAATSAPQTDLEQAIRLAYKSLANEPGDWVRLPKIRAALSMVSRTDVDTALTRLAVQPDVRIIPIANLKSLSAEDRKAAIKLGGEMKHAIAIEG